MRLARLGQACIGRGGSTAEAVAGRERGAEKVECKRGFAPAKGNGHSYTVVTPCLVLEYLMGCGVDHQTTMPSIKRLFLLLTEPWT
jgi:hypothetical protein